MSILSLLTLFASAFLVMQSALADNCQTIPTYFEDNRIYLEIKHQESQQPLKFYTDSGGGLFPFVYNDTAEKLGMKASRTEKDGPATVGYSTFPDSVFQTAGIKAIVALKDKVRIFTFKNGATDEPSQIRFMIGDGFLGASFFADKIWKFDYPRNQLSQCNKFDQTEAASIPMAFKMTDGVRDTHQPRIAIEVDGENLPVLFDTGATSLYSAEAIKLLKPAKPFTSSSFIRSSVAQRWQKKHPTWKVIKGGEKFAGGGDLIEVPIVKLGGYEVGPVWFATRKDEIYDRYSKDIMDSKIEGAAGGNLFRYFTVTADYPAARLFINRENIKLKK